jgi:hypothetical protein
MTSKSKKAPDVSQLFQNAADDGVLSPASMTALSAIDLGQQIQAGLGVSIDDVGASEVVLLTMMVDDSGSIRFAGNAQTVRDGHNMVLYSLESSKQCHQVLAHTGYLNGHVLFPYLPLGVIDEAERKRSGRVVYTRNPDVHDLDRSNYDPGLGTPLYDQTVVLLGRVLAKYQELADGGVTARTVTLILTDGADEGSQQATAKTVRPLVEDLLGERHIVAAMGIDDGGRTNFRQVFRDMGIPDEWILTPGSSNSDIRRAFQVFSQSAVRASQGGATFQQVAAGGFTVN